MTNREDRLKATQRAYAQWSETADFVTDNEASDEDESKFIEQLAKVDPQLKKNFGKEQEGIKESHQVDISSLSDEGYQEALEDEYLGMIVRERLADSNHSELISFDELCAKFGFTREELEASAEEDRGTELVNESKILSKSARERMLLSMDDGSHSLLPNVKDNK